MLTSTGEYEVMGERLPYKLHPDPYESYKNRIRVRKDLLTSTGEYEVMEKENALPHKLKSNKANILSENKKEIISSWFGKL